MHKTVHFDVIYPESEVHVDKLVAQTVVSELVIILFPKFSLLTKLELGVYHRPLLSGTCMA